MVEGHSSAARLTLAGACAGAFTERTRRKGRAHVERGEVAIEGATASTLLAFVRGERPKPFLVAVDSEEVETRDRVRVECSCSYFRDGYPCEHIFSVLLAIDGSGLSMVQPSALAGRLDVVPYKAGLPRDDDWFFEGDNAFASRQRVAEAFFEAQGRPREPDWQAQLQALERSFIEFGPTVDQLLSQQPLDRLEFRIHPEKSEDRGTLVVEAFERRPDPDHPTGKLEPLHLTERDLPRVGRDGDRRALRLLMASPLSGGLIRPSDSRLGAQGPLTSNAFLVPAAYHEVLLPALAETGGFRCPLDDEGLRATPPIELDDGPSFRLRVRIDPEADAEHRRLDGFLVRETDAGSERLPIRDPLVLVRDGLVLVGNRLVRVQWADDYDWAKFLRRSGALKFPADRLRDVLGELCRMPRLPHIESLSDGWTVESPAPSVSLAFEPPDGKSRNVPADVHFEYGDLRFRLSDPVCAAIHADDRRFVPRDLAGENRELEKLGRFGLRRDDGAQTHQVVARASDLNGIVRRLVQAGFHVRASGRSVRRLTGRDFRITSGIDWFDLSGQMQFEGIEVALPDILRAVRDRDGLVELEDGSQGLVPEEWMQRLEALVRIGNKKGGKLRFGKSQTMLLDILLEATEMQVEQDEPFRQARQRLQQRVTLQEAAEPEGFEGELRTYQREGLGWLRYVDDIGLGGCLADDMGLGKTVQVLAHLVDRKNRGHARGTSLVVTPRSLVYNWLRETERFTPDLQVLDYTGTQRGDLSAQMDGCDLVVTTYGTIRRDVMQLRELQFDCVILDEAQAIKNPQAQSSKAVRLLSGRSRLALSGTPVENDAIELWSIFEFLNPHMLGSKRDFQTMARSDSGSLALVARALRPLLLRRTKAQVLSDLPEKTELTIHCQLSPKERQVYDELRDHYMSTLQSKIEREGLNKARMHVLEALLRLRQASCHPGLIDETRTKDSSAKLEALLDHVREVGAEGHKALVFSQFVKLLSVVRHRLDEEGIPYAYLDGHTTDREAQVKRFMEDDDCRLFLISLKAGGLGLNLTAADYVFILDPWWNPAVEAQAIDRAHRIGQTRPVFAYRFVAQDTVEEKIIDLHAHKRKLADALVSADDNFLRELTMEDLRLLLGGSETIFDQTPR